MRIDENGSIWVDDYMRTNAKNVFAVGDCAVKRDFFTRKSAPIWLASTATAEARIAGTNIYGIRVLRQIQGTISAFSTQIGGNSFASAGMPGKMCKKEGFRCISATAVAPDRHPGSLPGVSEMRVKLIFADRSGIILGGQVSGGTFRWRADQHDCAGNPEKSNGAGAGYDADCNAFAADLLAHSASPY